MNTNLGKYLISAGFTMAVLSPFLIFIFGFPLYLLGIYFMFNSRENDNTKALWIILPVILYLPVIIVFGELIY